MNDAHPSTTADRWSLDALYNGLEDPAFLADLERFDELRANLPAYDALDGLPLIVAGIRLNEELESLGTRLFSFLSLQQATDVMNADLAGRLNVLAMKLTDFQELNVRLNNAIAAAKPEDLERQPSLAPYTYTLSRRRLAASYQMSPALESLAARLDISGGSAWGELFERLTSTLTIPWPNTEAEANTEANAEADGTPESGHLTLTEVRNLAYDPDPAVRERAYQAELAAYPQIATPLAFALNNIKRQVNLLDHERGHASPLDASLQQAAMSRPTLDAMIAAMRQRLPDFARYFQARSRRLDLGERLPFHGLFAPLGSSPKRYTITEARDLIVAVFGSLDPAMGALYARAFDESWIDVHPRHGKLGGAFCANLPVIKQSRILTNFDGSFGAISTLAHELGHAWHGFCIEDNEALNRDYTMPVAETASTFNEIHLAGYMLEQATTDDERLALLDHGLLELGQTVVDILSRFLFESRVFERCQTEFLDVDTLCDMMRQAQLEAYGDGLDPDVLHPYMWACKSHYYSSHMSFYNYPYAFGSLFATGLYARYLDEGPDFIRQYNALLTATPTHTVEDAAALVGIDITTRDFWDRSLDLIVERIDRFTALCDA
ncbi:MAG: M3 family oligoendopeptidase [Bacillota bacterium]|nr:M3 family oligoendopeptidase [Bacillota bacterium]